MINVTARDLVFNVTGAELDRKVRAALDEAATALVRLYGAQAIDLASVTTKTHKRLAYIKYVRLCTLVKPGAKFDEAYVLEAFKANSSRHGPLTEGAFYRLTFAEPGGAHEYRPTYLGTVQFGLGFFLIALHSSGAVTLPYAFNWPFPRREDNTRIEIAPLVGSELIKLVRSVADDDSPHAEALQSVMTHDGRRTWFLSNGTKLILALGWNRPEDANLDDLLKLKESNDATNFSRRGGAMGYRALVDVLERRYGSRVSISVRAWDDALRAAERLNEKTSRMLGNQQSNGILEVFSMRPSDAFPERLSRVGSLPGLDHDFVAMRRTWLDLQTTYLRKLRLENPREHFRALGYLNLYLFFYLPYWFDEHRDSRLRFAAGVGLTAGSGPTGTGAQQRSEYASAQSGARGHPVQHDEHVIQCS